MKINTERNNDFSQIIMKTEFSPKFIYKAENEKAKNKYNNKDKENITL